VKMRTILHSQI